MSNDAVKPTPKSGALVPVRPAPQVLFTPRVDAVETDDGLTLLLDVPGVRPEALDVRFEKGEVTVHGRCEPRSFGRRALLQEYAVGDFYRVFAVGDDIDGEQIAAELAQGVLKLTLPKREAAKPRRITVRAN